MSICASVFTPRIICPPNQRTFNSDGTRVSEVGLKVWEEGGKKEGADGRGVGRKSIVGRMQNPTYGFGDKSGGGGDDDDDDDASLKSGWSGETLGVERSGERRGSLMRRLFRRKRGEGKGGEEKGKSDDEGS